MGDNQQGTQQRTSARKKRYDQERRERHKFLRKLGLGRREPPSNAISGSSDFTTTAGAARSSSNGDITTKATITNTPGEASQQKISTLSERNALPPIFRHRLRHAILTDSEKLVFYLCCKNHVLPTLTAIAPALVRAKELAADRVFVAELPFLHFHIVQWIKTFDDINKEIEEALEKRTQLRNTMVHFGGVDQTVVRYPKGVASDMSVDRVENATLVNFGSSVGSDMSWEGPA